MSHGAVLSPVRDVLRLLADAVLPREDDTVVRVLSYRDDFQQLWAIANERGLDDLVPSGTKTTLVIVCDGPPEDRVEVSPVSLEDRVTPYDWIVVLSVSLADKPRAVRVLLLDLHGEQQQTAFGTRVFPLFLPQFPWVRVYQVHARRDRLRPGGPSDSAAVVGSAIGNSGFAFDQLLADVGVVEDGVRIPYMTGAARELEVLIPVLRDLWASSLTRFGDRHAVSNLVAPFILAQEMVSLRLEGSQELQRTLTRGSLREALFAQLQTLGLVGARSDTADTVTAAPSTAALRPALIRRRKRGQRVGGADVFRRFERVRVLLIDDQFELGYHDVLATLLFGHVPPKHEVPDGVSSEYQEWSLTSLRSPKRIIDSLRTTLSGPLDWALPRVIGRDGADTLKLDVLLVDLRLFSSGAQRSSAEEGAFLRELLALIGSWGDPPLDVPGLSRIAEAARRQTQDGSHEDPLAYALLPALLNRLDPSLPIVLFSSTRQRSIIDAFKSSPSVVTLFGKPIVSGYIEGSTAANALIESLERALDLHEMRQAWLAIERCPGWGKTPVFEVELSGGELGVFNAAVGHTLGARTGGTKMSIPRRSLGIAEPRHVGHELVKRLAQLYVRYLPGRRYFDALSVPYEFVEGELRSTAVESNPDVRDYTVRLTRDLDSPDNGLVAGLRHVRNRRLHGLLATADVHQTERYEVSGRLAVMLFLMLICFVSRSGTPSSHDEWLALVDRIQRALGARYPQLSTTTRRITTEAVARDPTIAWDKFALLALVEACKSACSGQVVRPEWMESLDRLWQVVEPPGVGTRSGLRPGI